MSIRSVAVALSLLLASGTAGAATLQEQYTAAQTAFDAGRMAEARAGFAAILPRLDANPKMRVQAALVRARMGSAATALAEPETGIALLTAALAALPEKSAGWTEAQLDLGLAAELAVDYDTAARAYRAALTAVDPGNTLGLTARIGLARVLMFSDAPAARAAADAALAAMSPTGTPAARAQYAQLLSLRGRIELNDGKPAAARPWFDKALTNGRSLNNSKVSIADVRNRGDLAIAAFQTGDLDAARKYLAYSGAGTLRSMGFVLGAETPLPQCAPAGPLAKDDMAIVEFSIDKEGRVNGVTPIFATRAGAAVEMARAVREWSWSAASVAKLDAFWRQAVRLELRCVDGRDNRVSRQTLGPKAVEWLATHAPEPLPPLPAASATALPALRAELARRQAAFGVASPQLLPVLLRIAANPAQSVRESSEALSNALAIAETARAPHDLTGYLRIEQLQADMPAKLNYARTADLIIQRLAALLARFDAEGEGQSFSAAQAASRLAAWAAVPRDNARMREAYARVLATPVAVLPEGDFLRQAARLQLASLEAADRNLDAANALVAATGLSPEQCSAVAVTPVTTRNSFSENDFPREALRWGFEGSVRVAFDIDAEGKPTGVRTVLASPPLVFDDSAEHVYRASRYQPIFGGGRSIGCSGQQKGINFEIKR